MQGPPAEAGQVLLPEGCAQRDGGAADDSPPPCSRKRSMDVESIPVDPDLQGDPELSLASVGTAWRVRAPSEGAAPRMIDRDSPFKQSGGRFNIRRKKDAHNSVRRLRDGFHTLVNMGTVKLLLLCAGVIAASWTVFALLFYFTSRRCGLKASSFLRALYLAVETVETIGYGVPDPYFNECYSGIFVLGASGLWQTVFSALMISVICTRISRPQARASSVCFSEKAVVRRIRGQVYFMVQACDLRKHQLIEAHVRLYCVQHAPTSNCVVFQTRAMRLQHPDDDLGAMLLLTLPQLIVHRVDLWSPLWPETDRRPCIGTPQSCFNFPDVPQRGADAENGNREPGPAGSAPVAPSVQDVGRRLRDGQLEVICIVEGIDPSTSMTCQARYSYTCDDVVFDADFQTCVSRAADGKCEIDFNAFHELVNRDPNCDMAVQTMP
uniref:Inward rectifier potassium channel C-terminal domain-containing protein n=1 Tax=Zooxanthella nutricula TaxID=1333877 RepID=A0A6U9CWQ7_9DINO|mmetsp:Transcript_84/g.269  ORF Transcript_84/g.269 Transcript_84/m.269 type:complete len:437 (+) Transcript_84:156-1466(+)